MQTLSPFKKIAQNHVKQAQREAQREATRTMRAIEQGSDLCYDFDSVDDTLDFCFSFDSNVLSD